MKSSKHAKAIIIGNAIYIAVFIIIWFIIPYFYEITQMGYRAAITAVLTFVFSPRMTKIRTQSGEKIQIKWLFSGKAITI